MELDVSRAAPALIGRLARRQQRPPLAIEVSAQACAVLLGRVRMARTLLPPDSSAAALDTLPGLTANQVHLLNAQALLTRNAALRRAHRIVAQRADRVLDSDAQSTLLDISSRAKASHAEVVSQLIKHHSGASVVVQEATLRLLQSRHLLSRASGVLDPQASSASDEEESAPLDLGSHPVEEVMWANASSLVTGTIEHSRQLLARCTEILGVGDDRQVDSAYSSDE
ncbi:hypothetical protein T492DRAFT_1022062 [Pavlovales sp. CCMP2436]|nr:hypothetical protein T492DRAFT_1022062 [Pavlovales sp. CCMP2436]